MSEATTDVRPFGVPLDDIEDRFRAADLAIKRDGDALVLAHETTLNGESMRTQIAVMAADPADARAGTAKAVIRILTTLPSAYAQRFDPEMVAFANRFAALGAFTVMGDVAFIGSRLTVQTAADADAAWAWQVPVAVVAAAASLDAITGAMQRYLKKEQPRPGSSAWTEAELDQVAAELSKTCACRRHRAGLSAEISLAGAPAANGAPRNAYWEMLTQPAHSELGGGLLCMLQLPQRLADAEKRYAALNLLNVSEMNSPGLPPHIGAWCEGKAGDNFAYVSFLPNILHDVPRIPMLAAEWAKRRAKSMVNLLDAAGSGALR